MNATRRSLLLRLRHPAEEEAWVEFHAVYAPLVVRIARRRLSAADAEDVLQDVLLALAGSLEDFDYDPSRGRFRGLLQTITQRAIGKRLRQIRRAPGKVSLDECLEPQVADHDWESAWRQHHLDVAMTRLESECSERDRVVFRRYAIEGADAADTAREFDLSLEQLYQIKARLLQKLGQYVEVQIRSEHEED